MRVARGMPVLESDAMGPESDVNPTCRHVGRGVDASVGHPSPTRGIYLEG